MIMENEKRYFVDIRCGCAAIRDSKHPLFEKDYPGLHFDTVDVVEYKHGFQTLEGWALHEGDVDYLTAKCKELNEATI